MDIILTEKVNNLGNLGDIVHVKPGYARNYLLHKEKLLEQPKKILRFLKKRGLKEKKTIIKT